ncbi:DUF1904 family protein [Paenibacillus harenae]|uniref:DUF1904 family protein n=1 Tax=Paenibacillus harenae TaxID=306543 RepID=A0ABT9TUT9_PAEHA|nr:DUF1904 family protein [Paenibacillus harenae]MDQ0111108.1 hypothetical protein [Paenibacillus harenae]
MPHLLFRGVTADRLRAVSAPLAETLADICDCGTDNFTISCLNETSVYGDPTDGSMFVFVEVGWFDRGQQTRNDFAFAVTQSMQKLGAAEVEVVFIAYREDSYYVNGTPC